MLPRLRVALVARAAAVLVAAGLSGAPRAAGLLAPPGRHQCRCAEHGPEHRCTCPVCLRAAAEAAAGDASLPPCHRAKALQEAEAATRPAGLPGAPCLTGSCGALDQRPLTAAGLEPFLPPPAAALPAPAPAGHLVLAAPRASGPPREPETPPPRPAPRPGVDHPRPALPPAAPAPALLEPPGDELPSVAGLERSVVAPAGTIGAAPDGAPFRPPPAPIAACPLGGRSIRWCSTHFV